MNIGKLSKFVNIKLLILFVLQLLIIIAILGYRSWKESSIECVKCHSDKNKLKSFGAEWAYITKEDVKKQSNHYNIECRDCHLGNGRAKDPKKAHKGMLKMLVIGKNGKVIPREKGYPGPLRESGDDEMFALLPKFVKDGELQVLPWVRNILWHDRDPISFGFDPKIAEKTCGKRGCHSDEVSQFKHSIMGRNFRQRTMRTWLNPYPHNCGPSFADLPPVEVLKKAGFDYKNTEEIAKNLNIAFTKEQAEAKQKFCNVCHAGCLDCHYRPSLKKGRHKFVKLPDSKTCLGYGRGASTCHPGAMMSRRGETYIGGDYSIPQGMEPDVHYTKGIHCIECHIVGEKGMGDIQRKASCKDCHINEQEAHSKGLHKNLLCAACHVNKLGGYQITIWGVGKIANKENPFHKYALYYGIQSPPIIMKDQKGIWMPVKIWPHSVGNIKNHVPPSKSIKFRWQNGQTRDAYYIVGTFDDLPAANKHLLWVEIEEAAHPYGKARKCNSCHSLDNKQISYSQWEFYDYDGAEPFKGEYKIIANSKSLKIVNIHNTTPIKAFKGRRLSDFASWIYMKDRWKVPGDFSIKIDRKKYQKYKNIYDKIFYIFKEKSPSKLRALHNLKYAEMLLNYSSLPSSNF